jgi:hypothetical protein
MTRRDIRPNRGAERSHALRANLEAFFALTMVALALIMVALAAWAVSRADAVPAPTRTVYAIGKIVPIPASIPHEEGDMVDRRVLPDLRWIAEHFPIYVTDGYSGPLPEGGRSGCSRCHTRHSDHYNGLAVDLVPERGGTKCDKSWLPITRLAHWAEPVQNRPRPPFRWVGYDGDAGHGCGNHLHLSWNHAPAPEYTLAEWVEVFPGGQIDVTTPPATTQPPPGEPAPEPKPKRGPTGGVSQVRTGGVAPRRD